MVGTCREESMLNQFRTVCAVLTAAVLAVPAHLPAGPADKEADMAKPVQVYILLGQSNMLGFGRTKGEGEGSISHAVKEKKLYPYLVNADGSWAVRKDVRNVRVMNDRQFNNEWMTIGNGNIGPEIGIGHFVGDAVDAPVLILKSCIGNRSLGWDLLPPGTPRYKVGDVECPGYKETIVSKKDKTIVPYDEEKAKAKEILGWYAGKQYDSDVAAAKRVLENLGEYYPGATKYEVAGFFWWQGDKDRYNAAHAAKYEENLMRLIAALRKDFNAPNAKFVGASLGQTAKDGKPGNDKLILDGLMAIDGNAGKYPENKGKVASVYSHPLSKGGSSNGHYSKHAETYMNVGEGMGKAMAELLK